MKTQRGGSEQARRCCDGATQELPTPPPGWVDYDTWMNHGAARQEVTRFLNEGFQTLYYLTVLCALPSPCPPVP